MGAGLLQAKGASFNQGIGTWISFHLTYLDFIAGRTGATSANVTITLPEANTYVSRMQIVPTVAFTGIIGQTTANLQGFIGSTLGNTQGAFTGFVIAPTGSQRSGLDASGATTYVNLTVSPSDINDLATGEVDIYVYVQKLPGL